MGITIDEAEFEDTDEVTPDLLEDVVVQTTKTMLMVGNRPTSTWTNPLQMGYHKERQGCGEEIKLRMY